LLCINHNELPALSAVGIVRAFMHSERVKQFFALYSIISTYLIPSVKQLSSADEIYEFTNKKPNCCWDGRSYCVGNFEGAVFALRAHAGSVYSVEICTVVFLMWHFPFTCSDTFADEIMMPMVYHTACTTIVENASQATW